MRYMREKHKEILNGCRHYYLLQNLVMCADRGKLLEWAKEHSIPEK